MLIESNEHILRVNGVPLFYKGIPSPIQPFTEFSSKPSHLYGNYDFLMSHVGAPHSSIALTPPISPMPVNESQTMRSSVIMKVENCLILSTKSGEDDKLVCRWENCYR
jgi:hypothetical protein